MLTLIVKFKLPKKVYTLTTTVWGCQESNIFSPVERLLKTTLETAGVSSIIQKVSGDDSEDYTTTNKVLITYLRINTHSKYPIYIK